MHVDLLCIMEQKEEQMKIDDILSKCFSLLLQHSLSHNQLEK